MISQVETKQTNLSHKIIPANFRRHAPSRRRRPASLPLSAGCAEGPHGKEFRVEMAGRGQSASTGKKPGKHTLGQAATAHAIRGQSRWWLVLLM